MCDLMCYRKYVSNDNDKSKYIKQTVFNKRNEPSVVYGQGQQGIRIGRAQQTEQGGGAVYELLVGLSERDKTKTKTNRSFLMVD